MFEAEAKRLLHALADFALRIEHVGSTAVPGLAAKPVIDIQVAVASLSPLDSYRERLEALGYTYSTIPLPFFHRPEEWPHTHHLHLREAGGNDAWRIVAFRDWLRAHPDDRRAYEELKRMLAKDADPHSVEGRVRYSEAKTTFVRAIEQRAQTTGAISRR
jgi:GrpB-like predicted nucleotidyltransferase (UPF0157 family)